MTREPQRPFEEIVEELGRYPTDAFDFLREGLKYTVDKVHGEASPLELRLQEWMAHRNITIDKLESLYAAGDLPERVGQAVEKLGGPAKLNRHVDGRTLCRGLRDLARERWGLMTSTVLARWNIRATDDFGRIVFALVENDYLQTQPHDSIDDFKEVFDFKEAFDEGYDLGLTET